MGVDRPVQCPLIGVSHLRSRYPNSKGPSNSVYNANLMTSVMRPDPRYELALVSQVPHIQRAPRHVGGGSHISYLGFGFTSAYNSILFCCLRRNVNPCCHTYDLSWLCNRRPCLQHLACCSVNSRHIGWESRFLPTPPAFDAPVRGIPVGVLLSRLAWKN